MALALQLGFAQSAGAQDVFSPKLIVSDSRISPPLSGARISHKPKVGVGVIIAVDVSGSSEPEDYARMLGLYKRAFESEQVQAAIEAAGGIAVSVLQFASRPALSENWVIIKGPHDLKDPNVLAGLSPAEIAKLAQENKDAIRRKSWSFAQKIADIPRVPQGFVGSSTFLSHAVEGAGQLTRSMPFEADAVFMDLNCDGPDGYAHALQGIVERVAAKTGLVVHGNDFAQGIERTAVGENIGDYNDFFDYLVRNLIPSAEAKGMERPDGYRSAVPSGVINSFSDGRPKDMPGILAHKIYPAAG
jgi:hypothetical protein